MAGPERCDIAIWDVNGELTVGVRRQLTRLSRHEGPQIIVESGEWLGRRVAIGVPQRLTAAKAGTLSGCLSAMSLGHLARLRIVIGPAAAIAGRGAIGDVVIATEVLAGDDRLAVEPLPTVDGTICASVGDGLLPATAGPAVTTDWAAVAARSAEEGSPTLIVAVVTVVSDAQSAAPPSSRRRTLARETGFFLGRFFKGQFDDGSNAKCVESATRTIQSIVQSL
jgi:hypothetical protein